MALEKFSLAGKVALVTGASRGLGQAIAAEFAAAGADIVLVSRRQDELEKVAVGIRAQGRRALALAADVSAAAEVEAMAASAAAEFGRIDILVNNAGICPFVCKFEDTRESGWDRIMDVNLKGVFLCTRAVGKVMIEQGGGVILNMSSNAGVVGDPGLIPYAVSKAGVITLTHVLALEWAHHNIRVNAIAPGFIGAGLNEGTVLHPELVGPMLENIAQHRTGRVDEIASVALFLASEASSYLTGQTLLVDGGAQGFTSATLAALLGKMKL